MSKQRSSRRASIEKKVTGKQGTGWGVGQDGDGHVSPQYRSEYFNLARSHVLAAWPQILQGLIEKAMGGGYQQTKLLLDLCDLATRESFHPNQHTGEQLCDVLLNNLQLQPPD